MLRREAEELQRQIAQLARNGQNGSQAEQAGSQSSRSDSQHPDSQAQNDSARNGSQGQSGSQASGQAQSGSSDGNSGKSSGQSSDQRIEQALSRLQQAGDAMKRSGSPEQSSGAAREAADRLREAASLMAGTQQQLASSKTDALSREADRLTQEERAQAERIDKLAHQQNANGQGANGQRAELADRDSMMARLRQRDQLASERQQLSDDLSKLQKNLRDAAREMASNQPDVAKKLRDAVTGMDDSDLDNHVQRTADWLRRGINPNANGTEGEIAQGLQKLSEQVRQAAKGTGQGTHGQGEKTTGDESAALDRVQRLRSQLEAMSASRGGDSDRNAKTRASGPNGDQREQGSGAANRAEEGQSRSGDTLPRNGQGQPAGSASGQQAQSRLGQRSGIGLQSGGEPGSTNGTMGRGGDVARSGDIGGEIHNGGGANPDGTAWGNINTGNNRYGPAGQRSPAIDSAGNPADTERTYRQGMRELNEVRQAVKGDPEAAKEVEKLARQMQQLDPSRFPGNPAMVEQMHQDVLNSVDRLELRLERNEASTDARTGKPYVIPAGYQDSVAEYYRKLSKNP